MGNRLRFLAYAAVVLTVCMFSRTAGAASLTPRQIVEKAAVPYDLINNYIVDARLTVKSQSMHVPQMDVRIYFKKPSKVHIESRDGFAVVPKQGLILGNPLRDYLNGYDLSLAGTAKVAGRDCYAIKASFEKDGRNMQSTVWIDKVDFLPRQIWTNPEWGSSMKVSVTYTRVQNRYWLPAFTTAEISLPPMTGRPGDRFSMKAGSPTRVTIRFSNYRVNTGISDEIFKKDNIRD